MGHIPPSYKDCSKKWAIRYNALVERYQNIIRFQTFGHIHSEQYSVTRSLTSNKPIGVEYIAGNAGSFGNLDPSFRLYEFNSEFHVPVEFSVYKLDLEESNVRDKVLMERWFDFAREFEILDLSPGTYLKLSE